jgi:hypothetical protein
VLAAAFALDFHFDVRERDLFSWMDPYQYYDFARNVLQGRESWRGFEIPSVFPFLVMPLLAFDASLPASLWVNVAALLLLLAGLHALCRELGIRTPSPLVACLVLSSPVLIGLSRTLYVEFSLNAAATLVFLLWLRCLRSGTAGAALAFGAGFGLGCLLKTTFPIFFAAPVAGAVLGRLAERRVLDALRLAAAAALPLALVLLVQITLFPASLGYYALQGDTTLPHMTLMGPADRWSLASVTYYLRELGRSYLLLLTPLLALAVFAGARALAGFRWGDLAGPSAALWLWLAGPLVLLGAHPLQEPRHAALCVVPAVLLGVLGIEALPDRRLRVSALALALALAAAQYAGVTRLGFETPYFLDRSLRYREIQARMRASEESRRYRRTPADLRRLHWRYDQNVAVQGFPPNEALALVWQGFPGVVFDLDTFEDPRRLSDRVPYESFEDLYFLAAIDAYNRRCGWREYHAALPRELVVANADFLILNGVTVAQAQQRFPRHALVSTIELRGSEVQLLRARDATTPYRVLYARRFLERHPQLSDQELRTVAEELLIAAVLAGDAPGARALVDEFPVLGDPRVVARNVYWIGGYPALLELARQLMAEMPASAPRARAGR